MHMGHKKVADRIYKVDIRKEKVNIDFSDAKTKYKNKLNAENKLKMGNKLMVKNHQIGKKQEKGNYTTIEKYNIIKSRFEREKDEICADKMSKYMRYQFDFLGLMTGKRRSQYKDIIKIDKTRGKIDWELLDMCYENKYREFKYFVLDYLHSLNAQLCLEDLETLKSYALIEPWWDTIDGIDTIVGNVVMRSKKGKSAILKWSKDPNFWIRRIAIDHQLLMRENTDTQLLEEIIKNNFGSDEFFINKAIGWSLREYSKTNRDWVGEFIEKYKESMSKLSIKEASKYL